MSVVKMQFSHWAGDEFLPLFSLSMNGPTNKLRGEAITGSWEGENYEVIFLILSLVLPNFLGGG